MTDSPRGTPVQLTELRRSYGGVAALDGLTLHMEPGEFVALLGPSGCGKTTALRCLAGLEDPDSGTIVVGGNDLTKVPTNKRDMGMVFQAYSLFPHMTARQNVEFGLELRGRDKAARRARAIRPAASASSTANSPAPLPTSKSAEAPAIAQPPPSASAHGSHSRHAASPAFTHSRSPSASVHTAPK